MFPYTVHMHFKTVVKELTSVLKKQPLNDTHFEINTHVPQ